MGFSAIFFLKKCLLIRNISGKVRKQCSSPLKPTEHTSDYFLTMTGMVHCAPSTQSQLPKKIICTLPPLLHPPYTRPHSLQQSLSLQRRLIGKGHASRKKKIKEVIKAACICKSGGKYEGAPHTPNVPRLEIYFANRYWHH